MVKAILNGNKTQTRRAIKPNMPAKAKAGDVFWVRETWQQECTIIEENDSTQYVATGGFVYRAEATVLPKKSVAFGKWKPSIFMPKKACRTFLECTNVRVETAHGISEKDIYAEGIEPCVSKDDAKAHWAGLWSNINGKDSWDSNPWVWVYDFKTIDRPDDFTEKTK